MADSIRRTKLTVRGEGKVDAAVLPQDVEALFDVKRFVTVIGIEKEDHVAAGPLESGSKRGQLAGVGLGDEPDRRVGAEDARDDRRRNVGGAVVDHDDFQRTARLVQGAGDRFRDKPAVIVIVDENGCRQRHGRNIDPQAKSGVAAAEQVAA